MKFFSDVWEYNLNTDKWRERKSSPTPIMAGTAIGFNQSHIAILGGADGSLWGKEDELKDDHPGFPKKTYLYHTIMA